MYHTYAQVHATTQENTLSRSSADHTDYINHADHTDHADNTDCKVPLREVPRGVAQETILAVRNTCTPVCLELHQLLSNCVHPSLT